MLVGKNLLVKQPHPSKTFAMYYLQHKGYNTLVMQVLSGQQQQSSSNSLYQQYTLTMPTRNPKKKLISCAYFFRTTPKEQPY